jgi:hypothetical protein
MRTYILYERGAKNKQNQSFFEADFEQNLRKNRRIFCGKYVNVKAFVGRKWFEVAEFSGTFRVGSHGARKRGRGVPFPCTSEENRERSLRRAKSSLRRKVKSLADEGQIYMLTVTYRQNMQDYERFLKDWEKFVRKVRARYPNFKYVCVAERQHRGAWHAHALVNIRLEHSEWEELWGHGFVWIARAETTRKAIRYISKYIAKAFEELGFYRKRYLCSKGLGKEVFLVYAEGTAMGLLSLLEEIGVVKSPVVEVDVTFEEDGMRWLEGHLVRESEELSGEGFIL